MFSWVMLPQRLASNCSKLIGLSDIATQEQHPQQQYFFVFELFTLRQVNRPEWGIIPHWQASSLRLATDWCECVRGIYRAHQFTTFIGISIETAKHSNCGTRIAHIRHHRWRYRIAKSLWTNAQHIQSKLCISLQSDWFLINAFVQLTLFTVLFP